jgi:hypothetical protein
MRRHLRALSFLAAASVAAALVAAGALGTATVPAPAHGGTAAHVVAGPDAFRSVHATEADRVASVAPPEQGGSARLLLLLATGLCALGLPRPPRVAARTMRSPARRPRPRAHQGVGLRAPPCWVLA